MREELLEKAQYKNLEEREELKNYFTQPPDMDMTKKTIVFTRAKGNKIWYAPSIPEMAPVAPTIGISD